MLRHRVFLIISSSFLKLETLAGVLTTPCQDGRV